MSQKSEVSIPMEFARNEFITDVRRVADELGLSMSDVSTLAGRASSYMTNFIEDGRRNLETDSLLSICNALDLDPRKYFVLQS